MTSSDTTGSAGGASQRGEAAQRGGAAQPGEATQAGGAAQSGGAGQRGGAGQPAAAPLGAGVTIGADPAAAGDTAAGAGPGWGTYTGKPTVTLLLRHGATELSAERRFSGRGDIALSKDGIKQAELAARKLAAAPGVDVIITSPLQRARRTAEAAAEATGAPLIVDDDLIEADFGQWQGLTFAEARERWPQELAAWLATPDAAPPGGESFAMVAMRVLAALDRIVQAHTHKRVVMVSHVTPIKTLICRALLAPPEAMFRMNLDVASLTRIDCFDNGSALVRSLNDTAHLHEPRRRWF